MKLSHTIGAVAAALVCTAPAFAQDVATVGFGTNPPLKVVAPKSMGAGEYSSYLFNIYNNILSSNAPLGRYIAPSDVVVLCPPASNAVLNGRKPTTSTSAGKNGKNATPKPTEAKLSPTGTYLIYVMGRRFLTIDPATAKANGVSSSAALATKLARQYMQSFPRECFRPPSLPALGNIPAKPPLQLTTNIENCVPTDVKGQVEMYGKALWNTAAIQPDGSTGPDKAAILTMKTTRVVRGVTAYTPDMVTAVKSGKNGEVKVNGAPLYTISEFDAKSNGFKDAYGFAQFLAEQVGKRLAAQMQPAMDTTPAETPPAETAPMPAPMK